MSTPSDSDLCPIPLGPFDLFERIGSGGMGVVYRARHRLTSTDVAVKVVRGEPDAKALRRFRREVQAHAALIHPSIVQLLEYGEVDAEAESRSAGALKAGSPYVGMELADGGTIRNLEIDSWPVLRSVLSSVLEALAHAHARGVIHRDLKPGNLLVFGSGDDCDVRLTDFGIAHALQSIGERGKESLATIVGTPKYMAPEQLLGRWRDHGPWTDLYALGCITFKLAAGKAPHEGVGGGGLGEAVAHLAESPPELQPQFGVPPRLHDWIRKAMARAPEQRFRRASEALAALPASDAATVWVQRDESSRPEPVERRRLPNPEEGTAETVVLADESAGPSGQGAPVQVGDLRPPPEDWRPYQARTNRREGAGLGLVGLRKPAFVGRESERDLLWNAYRRAVDEKGLEVVLLSGEAGIGKTHLAEWLVTFAHEMASARVLRLGDFSRASEGLEDTLRTWMMPQEHVYGHLLRTLPPLEGGDRSREYDARALTSILRPSTSNRSEGDWFVFSSKREKLVVLERLVRRLASRRPTIVSIDDLHAALPALDFVEHVIAGGRLTNVLVIATVRSDLVEETPELRDRFERLADAEVVSRVELGPMSQTERRQLARQLTSSDSVTELLVERMEGNPLFGVQLLTDWVERDLMRADSDGTTVLPEALEDLPADIHAVWLERIQRLEARVGDPGQFRRSLELAAVLGQNVSREDWSALCEADETIRRDLWDRLLERGLARRTEGGWRFAHGLLVTSLHRLARESGRWSEHHRRCAETLQGVFRREPFRVARRLADHWIEAGRPERALAPLLEEAERLRRSDAPRAGREVLLLRARLLDELGVPSDDLQRVRNDLDLLRNTLRTDGAPGKVHDEAMAILERISSRDAPELQCRIWRTIAHCEEGVGDTEASLRAAARAVEAAQESGNQRELAMAMLGYARGHLWFGREDGARRLADEVAELAESMGDQHIAMRASALAAWAAFNGSQLDVAEELFHNGLEQARAIGARSIEADALNGLGEVARLRGKSSEAATHYRGAISVYREMQQLDDEAIASMNLAVAEIQGRHFDRARPRIDESARRLQQLGYDFINSHIELARLAIAAGQSDWPEFDRALGELEETAEAGGLRLTRDFIWKAELARDLVDPDAVDRRARIATFVAALAEELRRSREARE